MNTKYIWIAVVVVAIIAVAGIFMPIVSTRGGSSASVVAISNTNFPGNIGVGSLNVGDACGDLNSFTYCVGPSIYGALNSTSTSATTYTAVATDLVGYSSIFLTPTGGSLTLTLPASTTLSTAVPGYLNQAGDTTSFVLWNASTTAGVNITIAAGTGSLLESASSTVIITPARGARFDVMRKANTDLVYFMTPFF